MKKKLFISFSGGVESTTMCILYGKGATAIWCDTGWEHKEMYDRIDYCEQRLKELHEGDFELVRLKADVYAKGRRVKNLPTYIKRYKYMPTKMQRFCTRYFKIKPIEIYLKEQGDCELMIGFNSEEEPGKDRTGNYMELPNVNYTYPLFENDLSRDDCEDILRVNNLHPNFPIYMQRGGCEGCIFKSIPEFKALYFFDRKTFDRNRKLEEDVQDLRGKFFSISMSGQSFKSIADECENEITTWGIDEVKKMYLKVKSKQSCGAFCHR